MKSFEVVIVGSGVSGIFTALELIDKGYNGKDILMIDKGSMLNKRLCFVNESTKCKKCKICSISNGVGGTGSYSDSKLNFDPSGRVGGDLSEILSREEIIEYLRRTYKIYQKFGIEEFQSKIYGDKHGEDAQLIIDTIKMNPCMELVDCITIHLGTDNSRIVYGRMIDHLIKSGVTILPNTSLLDLLIEDGKVHGAIIESRNGSEVVHARHLILSMGRSGNRLVGSLCRKYKVKMKSGRVDYGVRVETLNEYMKPLNDNFYEAKIYLKGRFKDDTRVFCSNPSGVVSVESYPYNDGHIYLANGHSYAEQSKKTNNTNFALLVSRHFNEDCPNPLDDYLYPIIRASSSLGKGSVICQSLKDIKLNRRSTEERIKELDIVPTANTYKGDLTSVIPYRTMIDILEAIKELDIICRGLNGDNTLLYGLEAKFHSNKVDVDKYGRTSIEGLYCLGDCSGYTRGITSASSMGILCAEDIMEV